MYNNNRIKDRYKKLTDRLQRHTADNNTTPGIYRFMVNTAENRMQNDGGANRSVTNNRKLLIKCKRILPYHMNGVNGTITCSEKGYIP